MLWIQLNTLSILIGFELNAGILINVAIKNKYIVQSRNDLDNTLTKNENVK